MEPTLHPADEADCEFAFDAERQALGPHVTARGGGDDALQCEVNRASVRREKRYPPAKADMLQLEPFVGLRMESILMPVSRADLDRAWDVLSPSEYVGFDTESRPTFNKGEVSSGPDVVQFATASEAFVFQLGHAQCCETVRRLLVWPSTVKVGFGLGQDQEQLLRRLGVRAMPLLDLDVIFRQRGYARTLGVKSAVAVMFDRRLMKSKRVTTSNWSLRRLAPAQLLYAANDAYAALRVLQSLELPREHLPVWPDGKPPQRVVGRQPFAVRT